MGTIADQLISKGYVRLPISVIANFACDITQKCVGWLFYIQKITR